MSTTLLRKLLSIPLVVIINYWFLPRAMALWTAVEYATDVMNKESWAKPRMTRGR